MWVEGGPIDRRASPRCARDDRRNSQSGVFGDVAQEVVGDLGGVVGTVQVGGGDVVEEGGFYCSFECGGFLAQSKEIEEHAGGQDRAERVGNSLPGDIGSGAVDRFEE